MAILDDLPPELIVEIFSRLPSKLVGKCRCLSKTLDSNLSTPEFIKLHFTRKPHQEHLLLVTHSDSLLSISPPFEKSKELELDATWSRPVGPCNGLVLLVNEENEVDELCLLNPLTTQKVSIPDSGDHMIKTYGLGYDSCGDDYKIVAVPVYDASCEMTASDEFVDVYSVKKGVWKRVTNCYAAVGDCFCNGYFLNGAVHFLAEIPNRSIIEAFDCVNETFHKIPTPVFNDRLITEICVLGERLCLVNIPSRCSERTVDIWTMEKYGSAESWTKLAGVVEHSRMGIHRPLCFVKDNEIVIKTSYEQKWVAFNVKKGTATEFVVDGVYDFDDGGTFFDSLISPG